MLGSRGSVRESGATDLIGLHGIFAIITGGAGHIGTATAGLMAQRGARLVIADLDEDRARALAPTLPDAFGLALDLADEGSIRAMIADAIGHFGRNDILHTNAALQDLVIAAQDGDVEKMPIDVWDAILTVNLRGTMTVCREALLHLRATRG